MFNSEMFVKLSSSMKFWAHLICFLLVQVLASSCAELNNKSLRQFTVDVIMKSFATFQPTASLIYCLEEESNDDLKDFVIGDVFKELKISLTIESPANLQAPNSPRKFCSIIFVDTFISFIKVLNKISTNLFDLRGRFAIVLTNGKLNEIDEIFKQLWAKLIHNVIVLYDDKSEVKALTFYPFSTERCNDSSAVEIAITSSMSNLFPNKFVDMKSCSIKVTAAETEPFIMKNKKKEIIGRDIDVIKAISKALNFKLILRYLDDPVPAGMLFENGSSSGAIKDLLESRADIIVADYFLKYGRLVHMEASKSYFTTELVFVVPPGRELKSIEKLLQPFSESFWISLAAFALASFVIIFFMKPSRRLSLFVDRSPYLSLLSIALGVSLPSLPQRSSSRILLMAFVMFCLVLQAVYQGSLYKFIQTDSKMKEVQSIEEMIQKNFKFYTIGTTDDLLNEHKEISKRFVNL